MVHVGAYCIRPTNIHNHGQMIDPLGMFWSICNTPLPIRVKNLIPIYRMNLKPGTFHSVCNRPLPVRDKYLKNTYLLNLIPGKDWIIRVVVYFIHPTNAHDPGQMMDLPGTFLGVCNTPLPIRDKYLINMYLLNPIPGKDWIVHVVAYCIRPTNAHDHGQMIDPPDTFLDVCNTSLPIRYKYLINKYLLNLIPGRDWIVLVGAYYIHSTNFNNHGQMIDPLDTFQGVCNTPLPVPDKYLRNMYLSNPIPGKD